VCFYNYSPHPKPPVFGSSNVCVLHDKATKCFFICSTEMRMIVFLRELSNREQVFFYASLDHTDLILMFMSIKLLSPGTDDVSWLSLDVPTSIVEGRDGGFPYACFCSCFVSIFGGISSSSSSL
jgi:hypothetical protein